MAKTTGTVIVRRDGQSLRSKTGKATIMLGGVERVPVFADGGIAGYAEKPVASKVTLTIVHDSTVDLIAISRDTNVSLEFACDSGPVYLVGGAFLSKPPELNAGEADVQLEYEGNATIQR
jgi:hypothetical protein